MRLPAGMGPSLRSFSSGHEPASAVWCVPEADARIATSQELQKHCIPMPALIQQCCGQSIRSISTFYEPSIDHHRPAQPISAMLFAGRESESEKVSDLTTTLYTRDHLQHGQVKWWTWHIILATKRAPLRWTSVAPQLQYVKLCGMQCCYICCHGPASQ